MNFELVTLRIYFAFAVAFSIAAYCVFTAPCESEFHKAAISFFCGSYWLGFIVWSIIYFKKKASIK